MDKLSRNIYLFVFVVSTLVFLYQHVTYFSWDFASYILNARYWFADGWYFEPFRPPLVPLILGILGGSFIAEMIFIILSSALFAYSTYRLSKSLKMDPLVFYALSLSAYTLTRGLINGTELISLSFLELFVAFLLEDNPMSGLFLGLSALSRYTSLAFFPLLFLHLDIKKVLKSLSLFALSLIPWFVYNKYKFGNFFMSIADSYANNIYYRQYLMQPINAWHFIVALNILIPFVIYGMYVSLKSMKKNLKVNALMWGILIITIIGYKNIPLKSARYLFNIVIPTAYFSSLAVKSRKIAAALFVTGLVISLSWITAGSSYLFVYKNAVKTLEELGLENCTTVSNGWVPLNYLGVHSRPPPRAWDVKDFIEKGYVFVIFDHIDDIDFNTSALPDAYRGKGFIISHRGCAPPETFDMTYLDGLKASIGKRGEITTEPCDILFNGAISTVCKKINALPE